MKDFYTALQHCLNAIDLGIDIESCLSLYPEHESQLRQFFQKWNGARDYFNGLSERVVEQILFDQILDECIKAVGRGETPENCYKRYPAYARRLKPWLIAVAELPKLRRDGRLQTELTFDDFFIPEVPFTQALEEYIEAFRNKEPNVVLARYPYYADRLQFWADKIPEQPQLILPISRPALRKRLSMQAGNLFSLRSLQVPVAILLALLVFSFSGLGLARASAATVPGEPLYPLKLVVEQIHFNIAPEDQKKDLKEQFAEERRNEASALIKADIKQEVAFDGEVTAIDENKLMVSNVVVLLDGLKKKEPIVAKGEIVHVEGYTGQSGVTIKRLDVHSSNGVAKTFVASPPSISSLSSLPSATPLAAAAVAQSSPTSVFGALFAYATPTSSGKGSSSSSGNSNTSSVGPSIPTSQPTLPPTQVPTIAPTIAPTPQPTSTAVPTDIPTAEPTVAPTDVPTPEPTAEPTDKPTVEPTAEPTDKPTDEPTAEPTDNPAPTPTESSQ
jgi:hypothetical protein